MPCRAFRFPYHFAMFRVFLVCFLFAKIFLGSCFFSSLPSVGHCLVLCCFRPFILYCFVCLTKPLIISYVWVLVCPDLGPLFALYAVCLSRLWQGEQVKKDFFFLSMTVGNSWMKAHDGIPLKQMAVIQKVCMCGLWGMAFWKATTCSYILQVTWWL